MEESRDYVYVISANATNVCVAYLMSFGVCTFFFIQLSIFRRDQQNINTRLFLVFASIQPYGGSTIVKDTKKFRCCLLTKRINRRDWLLYLPSSKVIKRNITRL